MNRRPPKKTCKLENSDKEFAIELADDDKNQISIEIIDINEYYNDEFIFKPYYEIIQANIFGNLYTFFGCSFKRESSRASCIYKIEGYFEGCHISNLDEVLVENFFITLPRPLIGLFESIVTEKKVNELSKDLVKINDNFILEFKSCLTKGLPNYIDSSFKNYIDFQVSFLFKKAVKLSLVYDYLNILKQFLDFNTGSQISLYPNGLIISKNDTVVSSYYQYRGLSNNQIYLMTKNTRFINNSIIDDNSLINRVSNSFFKDAGLNKNDKLLLKILKQWFNNEHYRAIYYLYIDSNDWFHGTGRIISNVMFNNRFLNIIQALEHYHRVYFSKEKVNNPDYDEYTGGNLNKIIKILKKQNEHQLSDWVNRQISKIKGNIDITLVQRLDELNEFVKDILLDIEFDDFSKDVKSFRDSLSHGNLQDIYLENLELRYYQSKYLLLCCILKSLNFDKQKMLRIVEHNFQFMKLRDNIKSLSNT